MTKSSATAISGGYPLVFDLSKAAAVQGWYTGGQDAENPAPLHLILDLG